jgi:pimeloyl-ACP methyl ester carboxylesterase
LCRLVFGWWGVDDPGILSREVVLGFLEGPAQAQDPATARRALLAADVRRDLDRVSCPSLVVWGARDNLTPLADGFEYARRLRAPIRTLAGVGHLLIGERPVECAAVLEEFLDGIGEVDELPLESELHRELRRQRTNA